MQEKQSIFKAFEHILKYLFKCKEEGNQLYQANEITKAEEMYNRALEFSKENRNSLENYDEVLNNEVRRNYYTVMSHILANLSLVIIISNHKW